MKRRLLPLCTALVLCLLLAPAAWAAVYPYPPIETLHIGSHDGTEIQKDTYYLVRGETVTTQDANADNYNIYYKDGTLTLRAAALPDYSGRASYAISVSAPISRMSDERIAALRGPLLAARDEIASALGGNTGRR